MSSRAEDKKRAREARLAAERAEQDAARRRKRLLTLGGVLAVASVIVLVAVLVSRSGTTPERSASEVVAALDGIPQDGPWLGSPTASVVVEEFVDPRCPFCAQFATRDLRAIVDRHVRPGRARMRLRLLTFLGPDSVKAARMAAAAGLQDKQWQFMDAFFAKQGAESSVDVTDAFLREVAAEVPGLDVDRAVADRATPPVTRALAADTSAARRAGVQSTPTFVVGRRGERRQVVTAEQLPAAIDAAAGQGP